MSLQTIKPPEGALKIHTTLPGFLSSSAQLTHSLPSEEPLYQASREMKCFLERPVLQEVVIPTTNEAIGEKNQPFGRAIDFR